MSGFDADAFNTLNDADGYERRYDMSDEEKYTLLEQDLGDDQAFFDFERDANKEISILLGDPTSSNNPTVFKMCSEDIFSIEKEFPNRSDSSTSQPMTYETVLSPNFWVGVVDDLPDWFVKADLEAQLNDLVADVPAKDLQPQDCVTDILEKDIQPHDCEVPTRRSLRIFQWDDLTCTKFSNTVKFGKRGRKVLGSNTSRKPTQRQ